jgi:predicted porin
MKKSLLALAALTAFAGAASAQSSVTLFGIVDLAATSVSNGSAGTVKSLTQDGINSSRLGFRGIEDLGGGLRAGFWIEGQLSPDTGCATNSVSLGSPQTAATVSTTVNQGTGAPITQPTTPGAAQTVSVTPTAQLCLGQTWQRRTTVSLIGNFGEIRLGRDYTPTFNNIAAYDPFGYNGTGHVGNLRSALGSGATTAVRASNTIAYFLPALGGLFGQIQVAAGEGVTGTAATSTGNKELAVRLGYAAGPVSVSGSYGKTYKTGSMVDDYKLLNFGASFDAGFLKVQGAFEKADYSTEEQKLVLLAVLVPIGNGTLKGSFVRTTGSSALLDQTGNQYAAKEFGVGYVYDLSKRTAVYTQYARINNGGSAATGAAGASFAVYGGSGVGFLRGETSSGYQFGIRHIF